MTLTDRIRYFLWRRSRAGSLYNDEWRALQQRVARGRRGQRNRGRRWYQNNVGWDA